MSYKKQHATEGLEFIQHSLMAFNGSGYADMSSGTAFMDSFRYYVAWKHRFEHVKLIDDYYTPLLTLAEHIVETSEGAGRTPSQRSLDKFQEFRSKVGGKK
jgi:hypothetical protein